MGILLEPRLSNPVCQPLKYAAFPDMWISLPIWSGYFKLAACILGLTGANTVDFRNFIVFIWAETLAH